MKVISVNLNGIRAAGRKGFFEWMKQEDPDIVCMQETKAQMALLTDDLYRPEGYHHFFSDAEKKGYSGVGIYCKQQPNNVSTALGFDTADTEGRYIQADFDGLSVVSLYLPSGSSGDERQARKIDFMDRYLPVLQQQQASDQHVIVCGDWNIVHTEKDIKNFKSNQKTSGCLPEERQWINALLTDHGWVDAFRVINQEPHQYTWWSNRGRAWDNNVGWRIDYQMITSGLKDRVRSTSIYKAQRFSDHAPLLVEYNLNT